MPNLIFSLAAQTVALAAPLIFAAMGGYTSERTGVVNIALEGMMLASACATVGVGQIYGPVVGLLAGVGLAVLLSVIHWISTQVYRVDHVVSGMAINALAAGGTNFVFVKLAGQSHGRMVSIPMELYYGLALGLPFAMAWYAKRTRGGLRMIAVGSDPDKARLMGVSPRNIRFLGLVATGVFTGLGGVALVSYTGVFTDNMTAGRGYIALAALILGGWRPLPVLGCCAVFGFFSALRLQMQGTPTFGIEIPSEAWASLPYLVTLVALAGLLGRNRTPAGLGKP